MPSMKLFVQGAEARLYLTKYLGRKAMVKVRQAKKYREKELDERIIKERMRTECTLLSRAKKAWVRTPIIWKIDPKERSITTEFIEGKTLKQELGQNPENAGALCSGAGENIAALHSSDLVHGDLTTSNIILQEGSNSPRKLVFLDFGLGQISSRIEDKAVDLLVFKKTFLATHFALAEKWKEVEEAYARRYGKGKEVLSQVAKVEARARYFEG